ncbi:MCE family protein [Amycolatopsis albispora]|uniref:ABC transporter substrate-binding protein n=1 Tax=Amycolatopsis albispora TaxID=1804986 RepID=A0A344L8F2_9PSEU|nr:MCE family protein [Amycolatopsis albispora]AXB44326.1 ABC transporter substrate-binding protein [Amycolatopsis albispora]
MTSFRERNPFTLGIAGSLAIAAITAATFYYEELPIVGGGTTYQAEFGEAAGLQENDEVRVAGIKVGEVTEVELDEDHVLVSFRVEDTWIGNQTSAGIKIKTLLGRKFLSLYPIGDGEQDPETPIGRDRTVTPYDVTDAFNGLSNTIDAIDTNQLATSFRTLSETFKDSPSHVRTALDGLTSLSKTVSSRDDELAELLRNARSVADSLAESGEEFQTLIDDGNLLLAELDRRRESIHQLLVGAQELGRQLSGLVKDNQGQLSGALEKLDKVTGVLQRHTENIKASLEIAGPYFRMVNNTMGNGRWVDNYICELVPENREPCLPPQAAGGGK